MITRRSSLLVVALLFISACAIESYPEAEPAEIQVKLALDESGLSILEANESVEELGHAHDAESIRFLFHPSDGDPTSEGELPDTRILRSEFDSEGQVDPKTVIADVGLFDVRVPAVQGRLELQTIEGTSLGSVDFDPDAPVTRQMELMQQSDILSAPGKIVNHGDSAQKLDILFLPEGYTEAEMGEFRRHVDQIVGGLSNYRGIRPYWTGFNIWRQDIRSRTSGVGRDSRPYDTAFETARGVSGVDRCVFFTNPRGQQAARRLARSVGAEATVVIVNSTDHGGCAGDGIVVLSRPRNVVDVLAHELGHAVFDLADEYETPRPGGYCSTGPNVSDSPDRLPWADLVNTSSLPTPANASFGTIGAFEGGGYCSRGRYRPAHNCGMRSLGVGLCPVCEREVARTMARYDLRSSNSGGTTDSSGSTDPGGSSGGSQNTGTTVSTPRGLYPDFATVDEPEIALRWENTPGAEYYDFTVQVEIDGRWNSYVDQQVASNRVRVPLNYATQYRWRVTACNSTGCQTSLWARFNYEDGSDDGGGSTGGGSNDPPATGVPSTPSVVSPAPQTAIRASQIKLDWSNSSGASYYNLQVQVYDANSQRWAVGLEQQPTASEQTIGALIDRTHYAWTVQACNASGCSGWTEPAVFQVQL